MDTPPPITEIPAEAKSRSSFFSRLLNIFAVPGEVFEEVKTSPPSVANWLIPTLIFAVVGAVTAYLALSQPAIMQKAREKQASQIEERVKAGQMTRQQADQAEAVLEAMSKPIVKTVLSGVGGLVMAFLTLFWGAFLLWLIAKAGLKVRVNFMKMTEVAGLASAISTLGAIIKMLLVISLSNPMASPSLVLLLKDPDPANKLTGLLAMVDIMTFWTLIVHSVGLSKFANVSVIRAAAWVFPISILTMMFCWGLGSALQGISGR